ncbi:non-ribosomal peptide synthetase [Acanthopleuribacter pedis]|uniref:Amino acid adenylation domain-containing protein n=1 Tax=Acanthopleuribacter pedis TaxID=442870 RepID=A0A8J7QFF1_9BACT|nr:non-ribosomal peptide synthetase [Acanthopleuribacter pedis]MBO1317440.1 amino acid adenylation domain-containing protein [Acanthopleuribacter pedis]
MQSLMSFPLTPMQLGMLYQWRLSRHAGVNLEQMLCHLPEAIDPDLMKQAWEHAVTGYDALRTGFDIANPAKPEQVVYDQVKIPFYTLDWRHQSEAEQKEKLDAFLAEDRREGFDITHPPLMRVNVIQHAEEQWTMLWTFHHIVLDGRSFPLVLRRLFNLYASLQAGETPSPHTGPPFAGYEEAVRTQSFEKAEPYWRDLLAGLEDQNLPFPHQSLPMLQQIEHEQHEVVLTLPAEDVQRLATFAADNKVTFNTLVQAAWGQTLSAYTGQSDVVFGTVRACRYLDVPDLKEMAGMLINTLPFRVTINAETRVVDWLQQLRQQQVDARPFEAVPLNHIQQWSGMDIEHPIVRTMLMFENQVLEKVLQKQGGLWAKRGFKLLEKTEFALAMSAYQDKDLKLVLEYNAGVYTPETARDIAELTAHVLRSLPDYAQRTTAELPTLTPATEAKVMHFRSEDFPKDRTLFQMFEDRVAKQPDTEAVRTTDEVITYQALNAWGNQIAHFLIEKGVAPGDFVGLSLSRSPVMIAATLGILKAGAAYIPLDPKYPEERLVWMIEDTEPKLVLTQTANKGPLEVGDTALVCVDENPDWLQAYAKTNPDVTVTMNNWAMSIFTSGSTGRPKGVVLPYHALVNHIWTCIHDYAMKPGDRIPQVSTINFDVSVEEIFSALGSGATLVLPEATTLGSLSAFLRWIDEERITVLDLTTLFWTELVHYMADRGLTFPDHVRLFICGGERATWSAFNDWLRVGGERIQWINAYGPTETCAMATYFTTDPSLPIEPLSEDPPIGKPLPNYWCYIIDPLGRLAPPGVPGELYIAGAGVSDGYLKRDDLTKQRFIPDRFRQGGGRMYKSGDRCKLGPDGNFVYLDRLDNQVKLRGFRIELGAVEKALHRHPEVQDGVVVVVKAPTGNRQLVAYAVPKEGKDLTTDGVLATMREELPAFMTPAAAVVMPVFPKAPSGKVDRKNLPEPEWGKTSDSGGREPETELETQLQAIWQTVLGVSPIYLDDDFFAMGGDSLRAMTMSSQIEAELGRTVPLALLLKQRTLGEYAHALENQLELEAFAPLVLMRGGAGIPLFLLHSLGGDILIYRELAENLPADVPIYGLQMQGLDQQTDPHETIAEAAHDFIERIREIQPQGPYYLAGYSSGGILALEIAQQLRDHGDEVAMVGILDSAIPPKTEEANAPSKPVFAARFLKNLPWFFMDLSLYNPKVLFEKIQQKLKVTREAKTTRPETGQPENEAAQPAVIFNLKDHMAVDPSIFPEYRLKLMEKHYNAFSNHEPKPYGGRITVFRTRRQPLMSPHNSYLGWDFLCNDKPTVYHVNGTHRELLEKPHVLHLAGQMSRELERTGAMSRAGEIRTDHEMDTQHPN